MHEPAGDSLETSPSILARAGTRDSEAWRQLVYLYGPRVFGWCRQAGLSEHDAADTMQEVWTSVQRALPQFRRGKSGSFRAWLWTVTRHKIIDAVRRSGRQPAGEGGTTAVNRLANVAEMETPESTNTADEDTALLRRAIDLMKNDFAETTWKAFWQTAIENKPAAEVAADLGVSKEVVYQSRSRVTRRLRELLQGLLEMPAAFSTD